MAVSISARMPCDSIILQDRVHVFEHSASLSFLLPASVTGIYVFIYDTVGLLSAIGRKPHYSPKLPSQLMLYIGPITTIAHPIGLSKID
jgi:hypothetical protein